MLLSLTDGVESYARGVNVDRAFWPECYEGNAGDILETPQIQVSEDYLRQLTLFLCFLCSTVPLGAVGIQDLTITSVSYEAIPFNNATLPGFLTAADPYAISNSGQVVGDYYYHLGQDYESGGFTYGNGVLTKFAYPTVSTYLLPSGINDSGVVILSSPQSAVGFVGTPGAFTPVSFPGATQTTLNAINDAGVVVGSYVDANGNSHGFIYKPNGIYTTFDSQITGPFQSGTQLTGINNQGDIVGVSGGQAFIFIDGKFDTLINDTPASINDKDQIFFPLAYGGSDILDYNTRTLGVLSGGYEGIDAYRSKMNNSGVITGPSGYLVVPTPEPATFLLTLPVLVGLALLAKQRAT